MLTIHATGMGRSIALCLNTAFSFLTICMPKFAAKALKNIRANIMVYRLFSSFKFLTAIARLSISLPVASPSYSKKLLAINRTKTRIIFQIEMAC